MRNMAKKTTAIMEKSERAAKPINVSNLNTFEEIMALDEKGAEVSFAYEADFLVLSDDNVACLSHKNQRQYFIAQGAHKAFQKQKDGVGPTPGLSIEDPLQGRAPNKLRVLQRQPDGSMVDVSFGWTDKAGKKWHPCWKRPDEKGEAEELGYIMVTKDTDPDIVTRGASNTAASRVITRKDGTDDLILYKIPERVFVQHQEAVAAESTRRAGSSLKVLKDQLREANKNIELVDTTSETEAVVDRHGEHLKEGTA